ncbi:MAG: tryptophan--tRNA ligase [Bacteroidota bacterium]
MSRVLTGIQSTGVPHLGNLLGAILPGIELANQPGNEAFFFIADLHSLTTIHDADIIRENTYATAAGWLACGFDTETGYFYRQSDIPEVTELTWYLTCHFPYMRLTRAHSFKDKSGKLDSVSGGLFFYPMLMAADILLYDAEMVPVGKDQKQHLEFTREVAEKINRQYGEELLVVPDPIIRDEVKTVPGINKNETGGFTKMSKSYGNEIILFQPEKKLRKRVMKIETDSTPVEDPKNPDSDIVYALYKLVASEEQVAELRDAYLRGGMGYGTAKQLLFEALRDKFGEAREKYDYYMQNKNLIEEKLREGAEKAGPVAYEVLSRIREKMGYKRYAY